MEPFKEKFSAHLIERMAHTFRQKTSTFDVEAFIALAMHNLDALELKQRSEQITAALVTCLPEDYIESVELMLSTMVPMKNPDAVDEDSTFGLHSWAMMPMCDVIVVKGLEDENNFDFSLNALFSMTKRFSAEFAIRPFLHAYTERTLDALSARSNDPSHHVRRLISEGTRPRLPWGMQLKKFVNTPELILPLLTQLRDDTSEYVRRSVANNLNDIAKDHPDKVAEVASDWSKKASKERQKMIKHACRTLLKKGHPGVLSLYGYHPPKLKTTTLSLDNDKIKIGESLALSLTLHSSSQRSQQLLIDYVVYHQKANGTLQPKVFKWKSVKLAPNDVCEYTKNHSFKVVTTRKYHHGPHQVALLINGVELALTSFELIK
ncbi:MAG: DNA alkylation repair protein [Pseudomonadota bacterium]